MTRPGEAVLGGLGGIANLFTPRSPTSESEASGEMTFEVSAEMEVRMLQISVTICANHQKVMEEARRLEREGIAKIEPPGPPSTRHC